MTFVRAAILASVAAVVLGVSLAACGSDGDDGAAPETGSTAETSRPQASAARLTPWLRGLSSPVGIAFAPGQPTRAYVVEQGGRIRVAVNGRLQGRVFLDVSGRIAAGGEQGLLGLAFHPRYAQNRRFYVNYTNPSGDTRVVEYRADRTGTRALPATARVVLAVDQPYPNHNGGHVLFGPDLRLWVGLGDGGSGGDPENRSQNMGTRLGKMLRLDVNVRPTRVAIAGNGVRNPWRYSFDGRTGDLWIGDVGQNAIEEIHRTARADLGRLQNYGWPLFEGRQRFKDAPQGPGTLVQPVAQYSHDGGHCSVTGGYVYRGTRVADYAGRYLYGDYCSGTIWSLPAAGGEPRREPFRVPQLSSFGEDARGELYVVSQSGVIYRFV